MSPDIPAERKKFEKWLLDRPQHEWVSDVAQEDLFRAWLVRAQLQPTEEEIEAAAMRVMLSLRENPSNRLRYDEDTALFAKNNDWKPWQMSMQTARAALGVEEK